MIKNQMKRSKDVLRGKKRSSKEMSSEDTVIPLIMTSDVNPLEVLNKLREFCVNYFGINSKRQQKLEMSRQLNEYLAQVIPRLCDRICTEILDSEPTVAQVSGPAFVFGDIHGNLQDLCDIEANFWSSNRRHNYVFLGDYVDRGLNSVEVATYLLALKISDPILFTLIRGNHEVRSINKNYTFFKECIHKFGRLMGKQIWNSFNRCFERLPLAAVIQNRVFCCHGGIPKGISSMNQLLSIPKPLVEPEVESPIAHQLLWNDPIDSMTTYNRNTESNLQRRGIQFVANRSRGTGMYYTAQAAQEFLGNLGLEYMIRAHESVTGGFKSCCEGQVITVFSSSHYCGRDNTTACIEVTANGPLVVILRVGTESTSE